MKTRNPTIPRKPKLVREWDDPITGWSYCLWQKPSGTYIVTGSDGDDWCEESGPTVKAAMAAAKATPADIEKLLVTEE